MKRSWVFLVLLAAAGSSGCLNHYTHVDVDPVTKVEKPFLGIRDQLALHTELHVVQTHGMGDNEHKEFCAPGSENLKLQDSIVKELGFHPIIGMIGKGDVTIRGTKVGTWSTNAYSEDPSNPIRTLYFSCLTWGDASRALKVAMLELDDRFKEKTENEKHRAYFNSLGKQFVNVSFSDPIIYVGPFGQLIREAVWCGLQDVHAEQLESRRRLRSLRGAVTQLRDDEQLPAVFISDSLGSRVVFDVVRTPPALDCAGEHAVSGESKRATFAAGMKKSVREVFMLANQLPLLELAFIPPPKNGQTLDNWLATLPCQSPIPAFEADRGGDATIVAFSDPNDLLTYHLTDRFQCRCACGGTRIVNVSLTNAKWRILRASNPLTAHSKGFKSNDRAIRYLVDGNSDPAVR